MEPITTEIKQAALLYVRLQLKKSRGTISPNEQSEMEGILFQTHLSHFELVKIATDDIVAE